MCNHEDEECLQCSICMEEECQSCHDEGHDEGQDIESDLVQSRCGHVFHLSCLIRWLEQEGYEKTCPNCRCDMVSQLAEYFLIRAGKFFDYKCGSFLKKEDIVYSLHRQFVKENQVHTRVLTRKGSSPQVCFEDIKRFGLTVDTKLIVTVPYSSSEERDDLVKSTDIDAPWLKASLISGDSVKIEINLINIIP